jgi:hypothetical protein
MFSLGPKVTNDRGAIGCGSTSGSGATKLTFNELADEELWSCPAEFSNLHSKLLPFRKSTKNIGSNPSSYNLSNKVRIQSDYLVKYSSISQGSTF